CCGTACYIKGANKLLASIEANLAIKPGETTSDGEVSLLTARCLGSCGLAPAAVFDGEVAGRLEPEELMDQLARWTHHDS
ncbi:MAG TPA: NAD(P)H-dependent oxidoreductase subunit E, partial [Herpetosiphonaceae bacterium]|nr:NAD(P)H-dependent oxidoreductase subunit E [Herpetosiphonaceae bacterium]